MLTLAEARQMAAGLARAATVGAPEDWQDGADRLRALDGRGWLVLDQAARSGSYRADAPISGARGWLAESLDEPTGFVATVTSLHADGRIRQRAAKVLAEGSGRLRAGALALRALDHVPQVREEAVRGLLPSGV